MILQLQPARARAKRPDKIWGDPSWIAEEKLDGWRFLMHLGGDLHRVFMTGRRVSRVTGLFSEKGQNVPDIWPDPIPRSLGYTVIDGEITPPSGASFRDLAGIMNSTPSTAASVIRRLGPPEYHVFDVLWHDGNDVRELSQIARGMLLSGLVSELRCPHLIPVPLLLPTEAVYDDVVARGGEGVILKDFTAPYGEGWIKVKRAHTLDVVVTGFTDAKMGVTGKYLGLIGAARVSVYSSTGRLLEVGRVSGMTDEIRVHMTENPDHYLGTVMEIAAQGFGRERLRHPRFKRHRPDADPRSATFEKMMTDLGHRREESSQLPLLSGEL